MTYHFFYELLYLCKNLGILNAKKVLFSLFFAVERLGGEFSDLYPEENISPARNERFPNNKWFSLMKTGNIDYKLFDFHLRHHFSRLENENPAHISSALERAGGGTYTTSLME